MKATTLPLSDKSNAHKFAYFLFEKEQLTEFPSESVLNENLFHLQLQGDAHPDSACDLSDTMGTALTYYAHYGNVCGLYWIWKNVNYPYVGFSLTGKHLQPTAEQLQSFLASGADILLPESVRIKCPFQENYRSHFYCYDYRMLLTILKRDHPLYYQFTVEKLNPAYELCEAACIMKKEAFRKFCVWLFPILETCKAHIKDKRSIFQNRYLEYIADYLFYIYLEYNKKKLKLERCTDSVILSDDPAVEVLPANMESIEKLYSEGKIEQAYELAKQLPKIDKSANVVKHFERYEKERRYYKETIFEKYKTLSEIPIEQPVPAVHTRKKKVLIFEWPSVSHKDSLYAFEQLGFEYESYRTPYGEWVYDEGFLEQFQRKLDLNSYDMVFSLNYFAMIAEACYVHDTPYVAWCYDSPTFIGDLRYLKHPTNHVFMFDSSEAKSYQEQGCSNVCYMPLAVNVDRFDKITCTAEEIEKYSAPISFVGSLYSTTLTPAMNYLTDYQRSYLNALVNNQLQIQDYSLFSQIINKNFIEWVNNPYFIRAINSEWDEKKASTSFTSPARLMLLLNKLVTNYERLILISMLSKHFPFNLYSPGSHEVISGAKECGTVEYYADMPKVFKHSKINLNMSLRSIKTGIPLRCLDICGCHGLLLSNHQADMDEHFKDQQNLLLYHSMDEAYDKVNYYLSHETERKHIEDKGYETVCKYFNYPTVLKEILIRSGLKNLLSD